MGEIGQPPDKLKNMVAKALNFGDFLVVQWLRLHLPHSKGVDSVPSWGANGVFYASRPRNQNMNRKQYYNKFNKDF